jgi:hypothetical protein
MKARSKGQLPLVCRQVIESQKTSPRNKEETHKYIAQGKDVSHCPVAEIGVRHNHAGKKCTQGKG